MTTSEVVEENTTPLSITLLAIFTILTILITAIRDYLDRPKKKLLRGTGFLSAFNWEVFIYTSMKNWCPNLSTFTVRLRDNEGNSVGPVTFECPRQRFGQVLHVVVTSPLPIGLIEELTISINDGARPWHISHVFIREPIWQEVSAFVQSATVESYHTWQKVTQLDMYKWRPNVALQLFDEVCNVIPILLILFPARRDSLKLDRTCNYVFGLALWTLVNYLVFSGAISLMKNSCTPTDVIYDTLTLPVMLTFELIMNAPIISFASFVCVFLVSRTPSWLRYSIRLLTWGSGIVLMTYIICVGVIQPPTHVPLHRLGPLLVTGLGIQVLVMIILTIIIVLTDAVRNLPCHSSYFFNERLINPEGYRLPWVPAHEIREPMRF